MTEALVAIVLAGIGTFAMRSSFLVVAGRVSSVGPTTQRYLRQIPPAALAAIVVPGLLRPEGEFDVFQVRPLAAVVTAAVAFRTKSAAWPLVAGAIVLALAEL